MKDVYIPLQAATTRRPSVEATMDLGQAVFGRQRAVVLGAPGAGKSLFLRYLAWSFCSRADERDSTLPVIVSLSRLTAENASIVGEIAAVFKDSGFPHAAEFISRDLTRKAPRLLILFDGLDEVGSETRPRVANQVAQFGNAYPGVQFIVTCRTAAYSGSLDGSVDEVFYVQDFNDELVDRFLYAWPALNARGAVDRLISALRDTPRVAILVRNPLLLTMLAYLYSYKYKESSSMLPRNRTQFYRDATELLLRRWQEEYNKFPWMAKKVILQHLALVSEERGTNRREMSYENTLSEIRAVLPRVDIEPGQASEVLSEIHERSGILTSLDNGERFQFAHLTMQEYFAASGLSDEPQAMIEKYWRDPESWREPLKLWCGGEGDATAVIRSVMEVDEILALECLADATQVDETFASQIIERMKLVLRYASLDDPIVRAFGLLASDRRPRGQEVFDFLVQHVRGTVSQPTYAAALAATNLKEAADVLAELAHQDLGLIPLLEKMGNLAVPGLSRRVEAGERDILKSLTAIGTPRAAQALAAALGNPSSEVARAAAVELMQLSASPVIEDTLGQLDLPSTIGTAKASSLAWAWQPFTMDRPDAERQTLHLIFGRIIELLELATLEDLANISRLLDPRLATFIFSFGSNGEPRNPIDVNALYRFLEATLGWDDPSRRSRQPRILGRQSQTIEAVKKALQDGPPQVCAQARDTVLAGLEEQRDTVCCRLLRLASVRPVAAFLAPVVNEQLRQPTRQEWLTMGDRQVFVANRNGLYHRMPLGFVCAASALSVVYVCLIAVHTSWWLKYLDFAAAATTALGLIFITIVPWNKAAFLDVWNDVEDAIAVTLLSSLMALIPLSEPDDFAELTGGIAILAFTPAWVYSSFASLFYGFGATITAALEAAAAETVFVSVIIVLFVVGQRKEARSMNPLRPFFAATDPTASVAFFNQTSLK